MERIGIDRGRSSIGRHRDRPGIDIIFRTIIVRTVYVVSMSDLIMDGPYRPTHVGWFIVTTWLLYSSRLVCYMSLRPLYCCFVHLAMPPLSDVVVIPPSSLSDRSMSPMLPLSSVIFVLSTAPLLPVPSVSAWTLILLSNPLALHLLKG